MDDFAAVVTALSFVVAFLSFVWRALSQFDSIVGVVVGLLLVGASIGAGILGFVIGAIRVAERRPSKRHAQTHRKTVSKRASTPSTPRSEKASLSRPSGKAAPSRGRAAIDFRNVRVGRVVWFRHIAAALLAVMGWRLTSSSDECDGQACSPRPSWQYESVTGVGDTDGDGFPEVLGVDGQGTGTLLEIDNDGTITERLETSHDWSSYHLIAGLGDVIADSAPEIFVASGEDGWVLHRTSDGAWREDADAEDFGIDWDYELLAVLQDVDDSEVPEILGVNTLADGRIDELMYLRPGGKYNPTVDRHEPLQEEGDYDIVAGVGDVDADGQQEILAVMDDQGVLLTFDSNGSYERTDLEGSWGDLDAVAGLTVFGDDAAPRVLKVRNAPACV